VDWEILAASPDYFTAVANAQICAELSAKLLKYLVDNEKTSWEKIHLVGFSLGGQGLYLILPLDG
jgi:dienelactone hydrolase